MSHEQRSAISFELHLFAVVKNRSVLTAVIAAKAELRQRNLNNVIMRFLIIEDYPEDVKDLQDSWTPKFQMMGIIIAMM